MNNPLSKSILTGKADPSTHELKMALWNNELESRAGVYSKGWHDRVRASLKHYISQTTADLSLFFG